MTERLPEAGLHPLVAEAELLEPHRLAAEAGLELVAEAVALRGVLDVVLEVLLRVVAHHSAHQPGSISMSSACGAPIASTSIPSGPASLLRVAPAGTRIMSHGASSTTSSSILMRPPPSRMTYTSSRGQGPSRP